MINTINNNSSIINSARNNNNLQILHVSSPKSPVPNFINPRFSPSQSSPCLNDSSHTISFASLNVIVYLLPIPKIVSDRFVDGSEVQGRERCDDIGEYRCYAEAMEGIHWRAAQSHGTDIQ